MADKGPFLTSCIIFYLSIGAAIFQILEEPNWEAARDRYTLQKENILKKHEYLTPEDLDKILEVWIHPLFNLLDRHENDNQKVRGDNSHGSSATFCDLQTRPHTPHTLYKVIRYKRRSHTV